MSQSHQASALQHNDTVLRQYYEAFGKKDWQAIANLYGDSIFFSDPGFPELRGDGARLMWRMLFTRASPDFRIELLNVSATAEGGSGEMIAHYTFSQTGRVVANKIHSTFAILDGKIIRQHDRFKFWKWAGQALGAKGYLLGWSQLLKAIVRNKAAKGLASFAESVRTD
jgi:ketosteroid isomerase-like protein